MIHTLMEVDSPSSSPSRLRGAPGLSLATFRHHHPTRMSKRARSPEAAEAGAARPSKRAAGDYILATASSSGNSSRQQSEDWVQQAGGLRIDSLAEGNYLFPSLTQIGPGPSTSTTQIDEDVAMAVAEDTAGVQLFQEEEGQENTQHPLQPILPQQRSHSMPNPGLSSRHPYGQHWLQQRVRNADGSPLINVVPATPADSQQSLSMVEAPAGHGVLPTPDHMLQAHHLPRGSPPLSDPTGTGLSTPPLVQQDLSPFNPTGKNKRVAFGPRLNCEKCRLGEIHFAHVHYE